MHHEQPAVINENTPYEMIKTTTFVDLIRPSNGRYPGDDRYGKNALKDNPHRCGFSRFTDLVHWIFKLPFLSILLFCDFLKYSIDSRRQSLMAVFFFFFFYSSKDTSGVPGYFRGT